MSHGTHPSGDDLTSARGYPVGLWEDGEVGSRHCAGTAWTAQGTPTILASLGISWHLLAQTAMFSVVESFRDMLRDAAVTRLS